MTAADFIPAEATGPVSPALLAKWLGVSRSTVRRWAKEGTLPPAIRLPGNTLRFNIDEVRRKLSGEPTLAELCFGSEGTEVGE